MKSQSEIEAEMKALRDMKPRIRRYSAFGDDHHKTIDLQISVLRKHLDADDVGEWESDEYTAAMEVIDWRNGEIDEKPSDGWKELEVK